MERHLSTYFNEIHRKLKYISQNVVNTLNIYDVIPYRDFQH